MGAKDKRLLQQLIKSWAQSHSAEFNIADYTTEGLKTTSGYLSWALQEGHAVLDLDSLAEMLEEFLEERHQSKYSDGMFCCNCGGFYQYAEPNQDDGSLICYSCRSNPY